MPPINGMTEGELRDRLIRLEWTTKEINNFIHRVKMQGEFREAGVTAVYNGSAYVMMYNKGKL